MPKPHRLPQLKLPPLGTAFAINCKIKTDMAQSVRVNSRGESLKAIDKRLTTLLNSGYESFQRSLIIIVGDGGFIKSLIYLAS